MSPLNDDNADIPDVPPLEQRPHKRRRAILVCDVCRVKKNRCDGERPACGACQRRQTECLYAGQKSHISETQRYIDSLKARNCILEQQLVSKNRTSQNFPVTHGVGSQGAPSPAAASISLSKPTGRTLFGTSRLIPVDTSLNYQHQRRSSSHVPGGVPQTDERTLVGSLVDSRYVIDSEHGGAHISDNTNCHSSKGDPIEQSSEYFGQSSTFDFMTKVCSPREDTSRDPIAHTRRQNPGSTASSLAISSPSAPIFDGYLLGLGSDELFSLPNRVIADRVVDAYFTFAHPLNTYLHEYVFRQRYERLWLREELGGEAVQENNMAWFGVINMIFAFGTDHAKVVGQISIGPTPFFKRAKTLVFSSLFQAASIDLVQALLLMGQYLHTSLELDNSRTVVGLAIRMAQSLGLHLDTTTSGLGAIDQEVRKRVWWGCFTLDCLLSMKVGRPPTIHDGPDITISLPLAVDDEYITNDSDGPPIQPPGKPSKFAFLSYAISQCRLLERICNALYSEHQVDISKPGLADLPKLLALSIQLDAELTSWQQTLPPHLQFDSQISGGPYERQRSTLLMRFLNCRLLLHRQIFLIYVTRQCPDNFQRQMMYPCIQRCVMAAHDTISQIWILLERRSLRSWWHNTHSVFTALCVMLAFKILSPRSKAEAGLLDSIDVDEIISHGTKLLQEVGEHSHPLASRYLHWFQKLERKLPTLSLERANNLNCNPPSVAVSSNEKQANPEFVHNSFPGDISDAYVTDERNMGDSLMVSSEELFEIENMFFSTGWADPVDD